MGPAQCAAANGPAGGVRPFSRTVRQRLRLRF